MPLGAVSFGERSAGGPGALPGRRGRLVACGAAAVAVAAPLILAGCYAGIVGGVVAGVVASQEDSVATRNVVPEVTAIEIESPGAAEVSDKVNLTITVHDTAGESVSVYLEYAVVPEPRKDSDWKPAVPSSACTLDDKKFGVADENREALVTFEWDTSIVLEGKETELWIRAQASDGRDCGKPFLLETTLDLDNNRPPVIVLDEKSFFRNPDRRRGIPIPFELMDEEGDEVRVVFQWRLEESGAAAAFPDLPETHTGLEEALDDPAERRRLRLATELPLVLDCLVTPGAPEGDGTSTTTVRLEPVAGGRGLPPLPQLIGRQLEILRPADLRSLEVTLRQPPPLRSPVSAVLGPGGERAFVLDEPAIGSWRLTSVSLEDATKTETLIASQAGTPSAMTLVPPGDALLVATGSEAEPWEVVLVPLALPGEEAVEPTVAATGLNREGQLGAIRGIACLGAQDALCTVGDAVLRLRFRDSQSAASTPLLTGLATPWGLAVDNLQPQRAYVAERDWRSAGTGEVLGRVWRLDPHTLAREPLAPAGDQPVRPGALALERDGRCLHVATDRDPADASWEVERWSLGPTCERREVAVVAGGAASSVAVGPGGQLLLALSEANDLSISGGTHFRREIASVEPERSCVALSQPIPAGEPPVPARGRILQVTHPLRGDSKVQRGTFVWDTSDVAWHGEVLLRAVAYDNEPGSPHTLVLPREVIQFDRRPLALAPFPVGLRATPVSLCAVDLLGGGPPALVSANAGTGNLSIFRRDSSGGFDLILDPPIGDNGTTEGLAIVLAAHIDNDGGADLVSANTRSGTITVFRQTRAGDFDTDPSETLGQGGILDAPTALVVADLNGDGRLDVACNSREDDSDSLVLFHRSAGGDAFDATATIALGGLRPEYPDRRADWLEAADVNADGRVDLVFVDRHLGHAEILYRDAGVPSGEGGYQVQDLPLGDVSFARDANSAALGDVDGDGRLDLALASAGNAGLALFLQKDQGGFSTSPSLRLSAPRAAGGGATPHSLRSVRLADLDRDGLVDVACANATEDNVAVFVATASESFRWLGVAGRPLASGPRSVIAVDLDDDGLLDLASANSTSNNLAIVFQAAAARLAAEERNALETAGIPAAVQLADLDGDGDLDAAAATSDPSNLTWFEQTETGGFREERVIALTAGPVSGFAAPWSLAASDLDGDGDMDLALAAGGNVKLCALLLEHDATQERLEGACQAIAEGEDPLAGPRMVIAADLTQDGASDLVCADYLGNRLAGFHRTAPGVFQEELTPEAKAGLMLPGPRSVAAGDFDGDHRLDLASAYESQPGVLTVHRQEAASSFPLASAFQALCLGAGDRVRDANTPILVLSNDFDLDGQPELVLSHLTDGRVAVIRPQGGADSICESSSTIDVRELFHVEPDVSFLMVATATADLDGDGDQDIVTANQGTNDLTACLQTPAGSFLADPQGPIRSAAARKLISVLAADIDGDGDTDLLSADSQARSLTIFYGNH